MKENDGNFEPAFKRMGAALRRHRMERQLSLETVADAVGIEPSYLNEMEQATETDYRFVVLERICQYYGISGAKLFNESQKEQAD